MQALQASPQLQDLAAAVSAVCSDCNCTGAANIAWAQATLQLPDSPLMLQVLKLCTSTDSRIIPIDIQSASHKMNILHSV